MLSTLLILPIIGIVLLFILPKLETNNLNIQSIKFISILSASSSFFYSIFLWTKYDMTHIGFQFYEKLTWFSQYLHFVILAVDGISLIFIILTTFIIF